MEHFWYLLFQLMKHGTSTETFISLFSVVLKTAKFSTHFAMNFTLKLTFSPLSREGPLTCLPREVGGPPKTNLALRARKNIGPTLELSIINQHKPIYNENAKQALGTPS